MSLERNLSLWAESVNPSNYPTLNQNLDLDIAIIGGGFSGLWSAFHLIAGDPTLKIAIFEARHLGFGASGRNGGWVSSDYPVSKNTLTKRIGNSAAAAIFAALKASINEIGNFANEFATVNLEMPNGKMYTKIFYREGRRVVEK